jgi:biopolymer transport protein ExbB
MSLLAVTASIRGVFHFFEQGGFFMGLLLLCSVISVAVMIWRGAALRWKTVIPPEIESAIERLQPSDAGEGVKRLAQFVREDPSALGGIVRTGLRHLAWPKSENVEAVQTKARHQIVRLENGLFILEVIVGIGPLLGLLGAVSGLVTVFAAFGEASTAQDPRMIAKGISEALSTTIVGIAVAIPSLIAHSYFSKKVEAMAAEMESLTADLLAKCYSRRRLDRRQGFEIERETAAGDELEELT